MRDWEQAQAARWCPCLHLFSALLLPPVPVSHQCPPQDCSDSLQSLYHPPRVLTQPCNLLSQLLAWLPLLSQYPCAFVFCSVPVLGVNKKSMNVWQTCSWRPEIPRERPVDVEWSRSPCSQGAYGYPTAAGFSTAGGRDPQGLLSQPRSWLFSCGS